MVATPARRYPPALHPVHALLLGGALALFLGALLSDIAYARTYEIQWNNFASWLIASGLVVAGAALVCAVIGLLPARRTRNGVLHFVLLLATWVMGFFNALMHARDAWASMPAGLVLSVIVLVLACAATWLASLRSQTMVSMPSASRASFWDASLKRATPMMRFWTPASSQARFARRARLGPTLPATPSKIMSPSRRRMSSTVSGYGSESAFSSSISFAGVFIVIKYPVLIGVIVSLN